MNRYLEDRFPKGSYIEWADKIEKGSTKYSGRVVNVNPYNYKIEVKIEWVYIYTISGFYAAFGRGSYPEIEVTAPNVYITTGQILNESNIRNLSY